MASTATGLDGKKPVSQLKGAFTIPHPMNRTSSNTATSLFSIRNFMLLFSISLIIKQLDNGVKKTPNTKDYPNVKHPLDKKVYCLKIKLNMSRLACRFA